MEKIAPYYKAVAAVLVPFLGAIGAALVETSDGGTTVTAHEWISAIVVALAAGGAVFTVRNADTDADTDRGEVPPRGRHRAAHR